MTIDMSQFYQVFFEETDEHLKSMEALLLGLNVEQPDPEQLNAIFRAAHSIKGSAGTFGFNDLAQVTHILENLLDRVRKGELTLRNDMIDAFLDAGDILAGLLAAHRGEGSSDADAVESICTRLKLLTSDAPSSLANALPSETHAVSEPPAVVAGYDIRFALANGDKAEIADNLLAELAGLGRLQVIKRPTSSETDGHWELQLETAAAVANVSEVLEFVVRSDSLRLQPIGTDMAGGSGGDPDGAYGFFDDDGPDLSTHGEAASVAVSGGDDPGGAFGFFEPVAVAEPAHANEAAGSEAEGDGFGFFVSVPIKVDEPKVPDTPLASGAPAGHESAKRSTSAVTATKPAADNSIRVSVEKVDQMINLVGELVITQAMLAQSAAAVDPVLFERLLNGLGQLERNTRDIQEAVMSIRMMPISVVFARFPRVVRDVSQKLGKQVELKLNGESTELDRGLIERIADPLTHLIRNSLDHGIEMPDTRVAKGKPPGGTITLKASHQSGNIVIEVGDDGAGLNRDKILAKARERGLPVSDAMTDQDVWALIFEAGFSTADQITEVSGRGVGMDVVKRNITAMGGRVDIESMAGMGTRMTVRLPLTLAILDGMSVAVGGETYLIPLGYVIESLQPTHRMMKSISGVERLIQLRGDYLPVVALYEVFNVPAAERDFERGIMIVIESDGTKAALFVDAMVGQHQVVIKSLEANYRKVAGVAGATIMGDGRVAMILDVGALVNLARATMPAAA